MGIFFCGAPTPSNATNKKTVKYNKALLRVLKNHKLLVFWPNIECIESKIFKLNKSKQNRIWQEHWYSNNITLNKLNKFNHLKACRIHEGTNLYEKTQGSRHVWNLWRYKHFKIPNSQKQKTSSFTPWFTHKLKQPKSPVDFYDFDAFSDPFHQWKWAQDREYPLIIMQIILEVNSHVCILSSLNLKHIQIT